LLGFGIHHGLSLAKYLFMALLDAFCKIDASYVFKEPKKLSCITELGILAYWNPEGLLLDKGRLYMVRKNPSSKYAGEILFLN